MAYISPYANDGSLIYITNVANKTIDFSNPVDLMQYYGPVQPIQEAREGCSSKFIRIDCATVSKDFEVVPAKYLIEPGTAFMQHVFQYDIKDIKAEFQEQYLKTNIMLSEIGSQEAQGYTVWNVSTALKHRPNISNDFFMHKDFMIKEL